MDHPVCPEDNCRQRDDAELDIRLCGRKVRHQYKDLHMHHCGRLQYPGIRYLIGSHDPVRVLM